MAIDFSFLEGAAPQKDNPPTQTNTANVTIRVDADSLLLCDGDYIDQPFKAGVLTKIQLPTGQHLLEFLSAEDPEIKIEKEVDFPESGKSYLVIIKGLKDLVDAAAEVKQKDAAEEAKRKAEAADTCVIPEGVEILESREDFLKHYKGESRVILPSTLKILGDATITIFRCEEKIKNIDISKCTKLERIGNRAFQSCRSLQSITIPDSVTDIGEYAFYNCTSLESITIPESVTVIGNCAFCNCKSLQSVTIPDSVTEIGECAFTECESLQSITIPDSITEIGKHAFSECKSLRSVTIPDSVTEIGHSAFRECRSLESITISESVTVIGKSAFKYCDSLRSVTIPDSVTEIGEYAFCDCKLLQSITIPKSVTEIGHSAFYYTLTTVTFAGEVDKIDLGAFDEVSTIYVPARKTDYYKKRLPRRLLDKIVELKK